MTQRSQAKCKKCGLPLGFKVGPDGKLWPCNPDGSEHYDTCREHRYKVAQQGERVTNKYVDTWVHNGKRFDLRRSHHKVITGPLYKPSGCDCGTPPWEVCKHSFPEFTGGLVL